MSGSAGQWLGGLSNKTWHRLDSLCLRTGLRYLTPATLPLRFDFRADMARVPAEVNRLSNQVLVHTYEAEWGRVHP